MSLAQPAGEPRDQSSAWVKVAYDAGIEALKAQREELNGIRTRAVAFGALTVAASAFLVGQGLSGAGRNALFFVIAGIGTMLFGALAFALVRVVSPGLRFKFILDSGVLLNWVEGPNSVANEAMAMRRLASHVLPEMRAHNEKSLATVRDRYRLVLIAGFSTIAVWTTVVWIFT